MMDLPHFHVLSPSYIQSKYNHPWRFLSPRIQRTYTMLGYNEDHWDTNPEMPDIFRKQWNTLSHDEQSAAKFLGYDEYTWNGCAGADEPRTEARKWNGWCGGG